jgi:Mg-chelatase subunit ChlD
MNEWTLLRPWFLLLLFLPLLLTVLKLREQRRGQTLITSRLLTYLGVDPVLKPQDFSYSRLVLKLIAWSLAIIAMAGPAHREQSDLFEQDETWVWIMDLSQSMWADDTPPSRLIRSRYYLQQLLEQAQGRRIALIAFSGDAYVVCPPTDDADTLRFLMRELSPEVMPVPGSNPVKGVEQGLQMLDAIKPSHGRLLLVTDDISEAQSTKIVSLLSGSDWPMDVLAVGSRDGAPIRLPGGNLLRDKQDKLVIAKSNLDGLVQLASKAGGRYFSLEDNGNSPIEQLLMRPKTQGNSSGIQQLLLSDLGYWLLLPLLVLVYGFRRGLLIIPLLLSLSPDPAYAADDGIALYERGEYLTAAEHLTDPIWKGNALFRAGLYKEAEIAYRQSDSATAIYNLGNALAYQQKLDEALDAYERALEKDPELKDAQYNRDLLKQWLSEHRRVNHSAPKQEQQNKTSADAEPLLKQVAEDPGNLMKNRLYLQSQKRLVREPQQTW